jgi:hypothetical protein
MKKILSSGIGGVAWRSVGDSGKTGLLILGQEFVLLQELYPIYHRKSLIFTDPGWCGSRPGQPVEDVCRCRVVRAKSRIPRGSTPCPCPFCRPVPATCGQFMRKVRPTGAGLHRIALKRQVFPGRGRRGTALRDRRLPRSAAAFLAVRAAWCRVARRSVRSVSARTQAAAGDRPPVIYFTNRALRGVRVFGKIPRRGRRQGRLKLHQVKFGGLIASRAAVPGEVHGADRVRPRVDR